MRAVRAPKLDKLNLGATNELIATRGVERTRCLEQRASWHGKHVITGACYSDLLVRTAQLHRGIGGRVGEAYTALKTVKTVLKPLLKQCSNSSPVFVHLSMQCAYHVVKPLCPCPSGRRGCISLHHCTGLAIYNKAKVHCLASHTL